MKMEVKRSEIRLVIYYCWMGRLSGDEITREINNALGENTVSERTCQRWVNQFNQGEFNVHNKENSGRSSLDIIDAITDYL